MKQRIERIVSIILTLALLVISLPVVKAENNIIKDGMIASFMPLEDHIQTQIVPLGTKETDLNLPETITVSKYQGEALEQTMNTAEEQQSIHWQSEPSYDESKVGEYHFTPELDNNMISHGVELPSITIQVIEETNTLESVSNTPNNVQTVLNRNVSDITNMPITFKGVKRYENNAVVYFDRSSYNSRAPIYMKGYYRVVDIHTSEPEVDDEDKGIRLDDMNLEIPIFDLDKEKSYDVWFKLSDENTKLSYKFKIEIPAYSYALNVSYGTGTGSYKENDIISITANSEQYMVFDQWVGGDDEIFKRGSRTDAITTIIMPNQAVTLTATYIHHHQFDTVWHSDETNHWHECLAGDQEISDQQAHQYGDWIVEQKPTLNKEGIEYRECSVCKYRDTRAIAKPSGSIPSRLGISYDRNKEELIISLRNNDIFIDTFQIYYRLIDFNESEPDLNEQDNNLLLPPITTEAIFLSSMKLHPEKKYDIWFEVVEEQTNEYYKFKIEILPYSYALKVDYGTGTGSYKENEIVEITATDRTQDYMVFDEWVGGDDSIFSNGSRTDATTTIIMPNQATTLTATYKHKHEFDTVWHSDETSHWHECLANDQEISDLQTHQYGDWIVDQKPTLNQEGNEYRECNVCKYKETRAIAKLTGYVLTIDSGTGTGTYREHDIVKITAKSAPKYMVFDKWVGGNDDIFKQGSRKDATTTIVMPNQATTLIATYKHKHEFDTVWHHNETSHWHECLAADQEISDLQTHQYGNWIVDQKPTLDQEGSQHRSCEVCGYEDRQRIERLTVTYNKRTLTDSVSGIQVIGSFSDDAQLEVIDENVLHESGMCQVCDELRKQQDQLILLYDIHLKTGSYQGAIEVRIPVDEKYNGQTVRFLHCHNQELESKELIVEHGIVKGTFSSLSPYAIAKIHELETGIPSTDIQEKKTETPIAKTQEKEAETPIKDTSNAQTNDSLMLMMLILGSIISFGIWGNHKKESVS